MKTSSETDVSEQLSELFVLCSALYFKLTAWDMQGLDFAGRTGSILEMLHRAACSMIDVSNNFPANADERNEQVRSGIRDLANGLQDLTLSSLAYKDTVAITELAQSIETLDKELGRST